MLRLSRKTLFAIEAVLDIAYHAGSAPVQSRDITRRQGIPRRYLEQALQNLVRHGVLVGVRATVGLGVGESVGLGGGSVLVDKGVGDSTTVDRVCVMEGAGVSASDLGVGVDVA